MAMRFLVCLAIAGAATTALAAPGDTLVGDPFILGYNGWVDKSPPTVGGGAPAWGIHLRTMALQEASDGHGGQGTTPSGGVADGKYTPYVMVNNFVTPASYVLDSQIASYDDDGFGIVFGFQDNGDYFRVGLRNQSNGNLGFGQGVSVQKVVGGTITQIGAPVPYTIPISRTTSNTTPLRVEVKVNGNDWAVHMNGEANPILSGTDSDLAAGKVGVHSWFQLQHSNATGANFGGRWGTELKSVQVNDNAGSPLFQDNFSNASPVAWRPLQMTRSDGRTTVEGDDLGNFRIDFRNRTIRDDTNGFEWATQTKPNVDFTGPAVVVDEPGSANMADVEMKVRMTNLDDDGIGVLVRVQDDDTFYRLNFSRQSMAATNAWERAPRGLSVQKVKDGEWSELFRDDQDNPLFVFTDDSAGAGTEVPFDVKVRVIGNQIFVQVVENGVVIDYPVITDSTDPILTGTVGLTNWGSGTVGNGVLFSAYGGIEGMPLVVEIPEPTVCLLAAAGGALWFGRRRRAAA